MCPRECAPEVDCETQRLEEIYLQYLMETCKCTDSEWDECECLSFEDWIEESKREQYA